MTKDKGRRITAQCIGIVLICFALGIFVGGVLDHICLNSDLGRQSEVKVESITPKTHYYLGGQDTSDYRIEFNNNPEHPIARFYNTSGEFTNTTESHFSSVELNFSLLDKDSNKIGDLKAYCDGLCPGQTWKFVASTQTNLEVDATGVNVMLDDVIITI